jgi:DMSO/TMAO reductase YedYZ heme-binding membrane subunit
MTEQVWWYATRAAGLMTWATAMTSIILGLVLSFSGGGRRNPDSRRSRLPNNPWLLDLHRFVGGMSMMFLVIHMVTLWADSFVQFGWAELLIPGASEWHPIAVAWGVVAAWLLGGVEGSSLFRRYLPSRVWHRIHLGSYLVALSGTVHAITAGSDTDNRLIFSIGAVMVLTVVGLTVLRVVSLRTRSTETDRPAQLERARSLRDGSSV